MGQQVITNEIYQVLTTRHQLGDRLKHIAPDIVRHLQARDINPEECFNQLLETKNKSPKENVLLGFMSHFAIGTGFSVDQAFQFYSAAANEGFPLGRFLVGFCYFWSRGVEKDLNKAFELFQLAAQDGDTWAQWYLGHHHEWSVDYRDTKKMVHFYKTAAEAGHILAQLDLARYYEMGIGIEKDPHKAIYLYRKVLADVEAASGAYAFLKEIFQPKFLEN